MKYHDEDGLYINPHVKLNQLHNKEKYWIGRAAEAEQKLKTIRTQIANLEGLLGSDNDD